MRRRLLALLAMAAVIAASTVAYAEFGSGRNAVHAVLPFGLTASALAEVVGVTQPTATRVLDGLVQHGWIERQELQGRTTPLRLTVTGEERDAALQSARNAALSRLTAVLAFGIIAAESLARIGQFQETWFAFRQASEQMKREYRLYINCAGGYEQLADEDAAYRAFVTNVEQIIAEEQQLYWRSFGQSTGENLEHCVSD